MSGGIWRVIDVLMAHPVFLFVMTITVTLLVAVLTERI